MKKLFTILGGISILALSAVSFTSAYTQEQIDAYQWAYKYKLTTQPTIEDARMNSPLTRQAFAKMVVNYLENVVGVNQSTSNSCYFLDEGKITNDLVPYTKKTCTYQIMGFDGKKFNPTQIVDRAQLGTVFSRILWGDSHNVDGKGYYIYHVNALKDAGIMNNISNILGVPAKRGDVLIMFKRMYEKFGSDVYLNNGGKTSIYSPVKNNNGNSSNLNAIDYNDSLVDIYSECDDAMEDLNVVFDDEDPSVDSISKSLKNAISTCKNAKDKAAKIGNLNGDSSLKDAVIAVLDANISFLNLYETSKPYWDVKDISEDDENYQKLISELEKKSDIVDKATEYLGKIQEDFAKKHGFELDNRDNEDEESDTNNTSYYMNSVDVDFTGNVVYTGKDGTVFYYDKDFLKALRDTAEKKGESDLVKYLDIEIKYYDSASNFNADELGFDFDDIDTDSLTEKEKEELVKKFGDWTESIAKQVKEINDKYNSDLKDAVKNLRNDIFGLKGKSNKTEDYLENGNAFLSEYCKAISSLLKIALSTENEDNSEEAIRTTISIMTLTLDFKDKTDEYNEFNAGWAKDTIELLGGELIY